ncbi:hypothetical protein BGX28_003322 [Mortierella sp. GBA30]|nr:hypothetical protein BGX28_003322 [Mortierella sp. GBA30]
MRKTLYLIVCCMVAMVGVSVLCVPRPYESPSDTYAGNEPDVCRDKLACIVEDEGFKQPSNRSQELRKRGQFVDSFAGGMDNDKELEDAVRRMLSRDLIRLRRASWYAAVYGKPFKDYFMDIGLNCQACRPKVTLYDLKFNLETYRYTGSKRTTWEERFRMEGWYKREAGTTAYKVEEAENRKSLTYYHLLKGHKQ